MRSHPLVLAAVLALAYALPTTAETTRESAYVMSAAKAGKPVEGLIREVPGGTLVLVPKQDPTLNIPLHIDQHVPEVARGVPLLVEFRLEKDGPRLQNLTLPAVTQWRQASKTLSSASDLSNAMLSLQQASERALHVGSNQSADEFEHEARDEASRSELGQQLDRTEGELLAAYSNLMAKDPSDRKARDELVQLFIKVRRSNKSIYGRPDFYASNSYLRMYQVSHSAVGIATRDDSRLICSGVAIAPKLVLTARHCLKMVVPQELDVWLDYEAGQAGPSATVRVERRVAEGDKLETGDSFDYVVLELAQEVPPFGGTTVVQCLSEARLRRDQPIYVVGHPAGSPRTIHDNAWVLFPFATTGAGLAELLMLVEAEFRESKDRERWIQQFRDSYRPDASGELFLNFSRRFGRQPIVAAEADTFHGNSGAPVFDRMTHSVVGIVVAGEEDSPDPWQPGWRRHEAIIPASQIIADLARFPKVQEAIQVCKPPVKTTSVTLGNQD